MLATGKWKSKEMHSHKFSVNFDSDPEPCMESAETNFDEHVHVESQKFFNHCISVQ